jgi:ACR3 family arsenite efflux pump ArsB
MNRGDLKMYTFRHFLFYMGLAALAGAVIGALANAMDWSIGLIYVVGLSVGIAIALIAMREGLFGGSARQRSGAQRGHHA